MPTMILTACAMFAFAANSLLCRSALSTGAIDPSSFTAVRVVTGAIVLGIIFWTRSGRKFGAFDWRGVVSLFAYMAFFSYAYISLNAGSGALILFGAVQLTMFIFAIRTGERYSLLAWAGLATAIIGLIILVAPGLSAPNPIGAALMAVAGVAWGAYSLVGRNAPDPLSTTARNFLLAAPLAIFLRVVDPTTMQFSLNGILLAAASGALASGLGYAIWYAALRKLSAGNAATVQLSVPVIAALGGAVLLVEPVTIRLVTATIATLGGVAIVLSQRSQTQLR